MSADGKSPDLAATPAQDKAPDQLPGLDNLLRLSFDSVKDSSAYWRKNAAISTQIWLWHESVGNREARLELPGVCDLCQRQTKFSATPHKAPEGDPFAYRVSWWSELACDCGKTTIDRTVFRILLDGARPEDHIYHVGHHSAFRWWLSEKMPDVTASQFEEGRRPGEIENGVRYEDLTALSFADGAFDCVVCMEVLEHVPDFHAALREMARVLKPGGRALLTFPWLGGEHYDHFIRAERLADGSIHHIHPPEYHGDPALSQGILSYRVFGWKILDDMRAAGFSQASAKFVFGPLHGHMQLVIPVIVGLR